MVNYLLVGSICFQHDVIRENFCRQLNPGGPETTSDI